MLIRNKVRRESREIDKTWYRLCFTGRRKHRNEIGMIVEKKIECVIFRDYMKINRNKFYLGNICAAHLK